MVFVAFKSNLSLSEPQSDKICWISLERGPEISIYPWWGTGSTGHLMHSSEAISAAIYFGRRNTRVLLGRVYRYPSLFNLQSNYFLFLYIMISEYSQNESRMASRRHTNDQKTLRMTPKLLQESPRMIWK